MSDQPLLGGRREGGLRFGDLGEEQQGLIRSIQEALGGARTPRDSNRANRRPRLRPQRAQGEWDETTGLYFSTTNPDVPRIYDSEGRELNSQQIKDVMRNLEPDERQQFAEAMDNRLGGAQYRQMLNDLSGSGSSSLFVTRENQAPGEQNGPQARLHTDKYGSTTLYVPGRRGAITVSDRIGDTAQSLSRLDQEQLDGLVSQYGINVEGMEGQDKINRIAEALAVKAGRQR